MTTTDSQADVIGVNPDIVGKAGGEGVVIRCGDGRALKVKPEQTDRFGGEQITLRISTNTLGQRHER